MKCNLLTHDLKQTQISLYFSLQRTRGSTFLCIHLIEWWLYQIPGLADKLLQKTIAYKTSFIEQNRRLTSGQTGTVRILYSVDRAS
jgi:hypothetical protein